MEMDLFGFAEIPVSEEIKDTLPLIIQEAEKLFGDRIEDYSFPTVEFRDVPEPLLEKHRDGRLVIVARSMVSETDYEGCSECAHEVIHALSPFDWPEHTSTVLEEGLATEFQRYIRDEWCTGAQKPFEGHPDYPEYLKAMETVQELLDHDEGAIRKLRAKEKIIGLITAELIRKVFPNLREGLAEELAKPLSQMKREIAAEKKEGAVTCPRLMYQA